MAGKKKSIVITVGDEALPKIQEVAEKLDAKGLKVSQVLPRTGVITGTCDASEIASLEEVEGVLSVEEEAVAELPPNDSSVQ